MHSLVDTIDDVFLILFDTVVVAVILLNSLVTLRELKEFQTLRIRSLTQVLIEQSRYASVIVYGG